MASAPVPDVDRSRFQSRIARLVERMKSWPFDAIVLVMGKATEDASEPKTSAMHLWLLTIEFPEAVIAICRDGRVIIWTSQKKLDYLRPIESPNIKKITRTLPLTKVDNAQLEDLRKEILNGKESAVVGMIQKEVHFGPFAEAVQKGLGEMPSLQVKDCRDEISTLLAPKDAEELSLLKKAARFCALSMNVFVSRLVDMVDSEQPKISSQFCSEIEALPEEKALMKKWAEEYHFEEGELEMAEVALQHGKALKLKATDPADCSIPMQGTYLLSLGVKYMEYSASITRTIVIDPVPVQKNAYAVALAAQAAVVAALAPGKTFKELYLVAKRTVEGSDKTLVPKLGPSVGWVLGMEYRDPQSVINEKSSRVVEPGMVFNIAVGMLENLPDGSGQAWAVWISDTVMLPLEPTPPLMLTAEVSKESDEIMYHMADEEEPPPPPNSSTQPPSQTADVTLPMASQPQQQQQQQQQATSSTAAPPSEAAPNGEQAAANAAKPAKAAAGKGKAKAEPKSAKAKAKEKAAATPPPKAKAGVATAAAAGGQPPAPRVSARTQKAAATAATPPPPKAPAAAPPPAQAAAPARRAVRIAGATAPAEDPARSSRRLRSRNEQTKNDIQVQVQMDNQMVEKRLRLLEQQRERFKNMATKLEENTSISKIANLKAYPSPNDLPSNLRPNRVHIDMKAEALLVPIFGVYVPFNARTVKNITKSRSDQTEYLRVNFVTPGTHGKNESDFPVVGGRRMCIKELSFRSDSVENFDKLIRVFKELQKQMRQKDLEGERGKLVGEASKGLQVSRGSTFPNITDVQMRPNVSSSKRTIGNLEAHTTGFRFSVRGTTERVDILYSQVKLAIFEPTAKHSLMALIHFHLHEPIIFGTRRTQDVQFFTEVGQASEDLSQRKAGSIHDPDEIQEEQFDRILRKRLNEAFRNFAKKVEAIPTCTLKFTIPLHDIMFTGVPHRANVDLCPCGSALVALQSWPPFCLCLNDIECVVFERDIMSLHELDMTFVLKDYDKHPPRITAVPRKFRDMIRGWLFDNDIVWFSSQLNMNWKEVIAEVSKDLKKFVENGGWNNWFDTGDSDEDGNHSDDGESDYKASGSEDDAVDDAGSEEGSDFDADEDESSSAEEDDDDDEESGQDWDELEKRAEKEDKRRDAEKRAAQHAAPAKPAKKARR